MERERAELMEPMKRPTERLMETGRPAEMELAERAERTQGPRTSWLTLAARVQESQTWEARTPECRISAQGPIRRSTALRLWLIRLTSALRLSLIRLTLADRRPSLQR